MKSTIAILATVSATLLGGVVLLLLLDVEPPNWLIQLVVLGVVAIMLFAARYGCRRHVNIKRAYTLVLVGMFCGMLCHGLGVVGAFVGTFLYFSYGLPRPTWFDGNWPARVFELAVQYVPLIGAAGGMALGVLIAFIRRNREIEARVT